MFLKKVTKGVGRKFPGESQ